MPVQRNLDAATAWHLLTGARPPGVEEPISIPAAQLKAEWSVFGEELTLYWNYALERGPDPGWPDPKRPEKPWAQLVLEEGVSDAEARTRLDRAMGWSSDAESRQVWELAEDGGLSDAISAT